MFSTCSTETYTYIDFLHMQVTYKILSAPHTIAAWIMDSIPVYPMDHIGYTIYAWMATLSAVSVMRIAVLQCESCQRYSCNRTTCILWGLPTLKHSTHFLRLNFRIW